MSFTIIIPARLASSRLPGKVLLDIAGKSMLQRVYEQATKTVAKQIIIATDDPKIQQVAVGFAAKVCLTDPKHQSGTERIAEVINLLGYSDDEIVVNVQADEPLIPPEIIEQTAANLVNHPAADIATLSVPIQNVADIDNPNIVKVITDKNGYALYFSRAPIPWDRAARATKQIATVNSATIYQRHIGLYAYRVRAIKQYFSWPATQLEQIEALEQLRMLWHGGKIHVQEAKGTVPIDVNTAKDLHAVRKILQKILPNEAN